MRGIQEYWNEIVRLTEDKNNVLQGLRNALFLDLKQYPQSIKREVVYFVKILKILFSPQRKISHKAKSKFLFVISANTDAVYGNIRPLLKQIKNEDIFLIVSKDVHLDAAFLENGNYIFKNELYRYLNIFERIKFLSTTIRLSYHLINSLKNSKVLSGNNIKVKRFRFISVFNILQVLINISASKKLIVHNETKAIISTSDYFPIEYSVFVAGKSLGVTTFLIQHGVIGFSHVPFTADYMFVWNNYFKNDIISKDSTVENRILIGGSPGFENLMLCNKVTEKKDLKKKFIILSDTQGKSLYPATYKAYEKFLNSLIPNDNYEWIVKLHPAEDRNFYNKYEAQGVLKVLPKETKLSDALDIASVAFTIWSTAGLDSMIFGIPTVILDLNQEVKNFVWWPIEGGGVYFSELTNLESLLIPTVIKNILKKQKLFLEKVLTNNKNASVNILRIISEMVEIQK